MGKAGNSLAQRIRRLEAAAAKAKALKRGTTLSFVPMAELLGVSRVTLRDEWCTLPGFEESGAFVRGGNGIEWEFKPLATIRWLTRHFEGQRKAQVAAARKVRKALGGDALDDVPEEMGLDEIAKMVRVAGQLREERERQGELVETATVAGALDRMFTKMQQAGLRAAREQDPTGQFPPDIAERFENAVNSVLLEMGAAGREALRAIRGSAA